MSSPPAPARVLLVEDDATTLRALRRGLERAGFEVLGSEGGAEALALLEREAVDLLVTDLRLHEMSGMELLRTVQQRAPDVEVVIVSAQAHFELAVQCLRAGAFDFLHKPFEPGQLHASLLRALEQRRHRAANALYASSQAILQALEPAELPRCIVEFARAALEADDASLLLPDAGGGLRLGHGPRVPVPTGAPLEAELALRVVAGRRPRVLHGSLAAYPELSDLAGQHNARSSIIFPLFAGERLVGVLNMGRRSGRPFGALDLERASVLGSQVLLALENARLVREALLAERLAGLGELVAGVAHEINNPVAFVLSNMGFVAEELDEHAAPALQEARCALSEAQDGARRIRDLVRDLTGLARMDGDAQEVVDLGEALRSALRVGTAALRVCGAVEVDVAPGLYVRGSAGRLSQVFINLVVNAAHALEPLPAARRTLRIHARAAGAHALVEVEDTGAGIEPALLERIFEPFFTTKAPGRGTGLGLSIARDLVRKHGGNLGVRSTHGEGSCFSVSLPLAHAAGN